MPTEIRETLCRPSKATAVGLVRREAQLQPEPEDETQGPASTDPVSPASKRGTAGFVGKAAAEG